MAEAIRGILLDNFGRPIAAASVLVNKAGTVTAATLYSDEALTASIANPLTTEIDGSYLAFAANGKYDLVKTKTGYNFDDTDSVGEVLFDPMITRTVSATDTLSEKDYVVLLDASGAPFTFNLMALSTITDGRPFVLIKKDATANAVTVDPSGAETINGVATVSLASTKQGIIIVKAGTEWITYTPILPAREVANGLAGLDASLKVIRDPANAQTTAAAAKIPISGGDGRLAWGWKSSTRGAVVYALGAQTITTATATNLNFNAESYDSDNIHDNVTNNQRLTVPVGVTRVRLTANVVFDSNAAGYRGVEIIRNGTVVLGDIIPSVRCVPVTGVPTAVNLVSPEIVAVAGDYFTVNVYQTSGGNLDVNPGGAYDERSWFAMEILN